MTDIKNNDLAQEMGISLLKRYTEAESAKILDINLSVLVDLRTQRKIEYLKLPNGGIEYFGVNLVDYVTSTLQPAIDFSSKPEDRKIIIRFKDVKAITGLSRTTIWRYERDGLFPRRIALGGGSIGWYQNEIEHWVASRKQSATH